MQIRRRALPVLLALILVLTALPVRALAETSESAPDSQKPEDSILTELLKMDEGEEDENDYYTQAPPELGEAAVPAPLAAGETPLTASTSGGKTITVYSDTNISEVIAVLGPPQLETRPSRWGGSAYSFYTGDFNDYMYFETKVDGTIGLYSIVGCNFNCRYGEMGGARRYAQGVITSGYDSDGSTGKLWAISAPNEGYNLNQIRADQGAAIAAYEADAAVAESIAHHAALMWNAVAAYKGKSVRLEFDSRAFYINRQLMENGSSFYQYSRSTGSGEYSLIWNSPIPSSDLYEKNFKPYLYGDPNPLSYASYAARYSPPSGSYLVCDQYTDGHITIGTLNPSYFAEKKDVPLTTEESARLARMTALYSKSLKEWNEAIANGTYADDGDQYQNLPLKAGTIRQGILEGAADFLNAVRVGAGLPELELDSTLCENAQCKAVLTMYMTYNKISNPSPHTPAKPAGVDQAFFDKTVPNGGENLYQGNVLTSIINALDDGMGDPITCGHRYNLLDPYYTKIGLGSCAGQGCHKFDSVGRPSSVPEAVCWPSNGVMMSEAGLSGGKMFTVQFYNRSYSTTTDTGVIFKCLNTGETVAFESGMSSSVSASRSMSVMSNMVSYRDNSISLSPGCVYEITVTNVKNSAGELTDYTYRSAYVSLGGSSAGAALELSEDTLSLQQGERHKLNAVVIPADISNKMVTWSSSDDNIASVTGNGTVAAKNVGTAVITARLDDGTSMSCTVSVREPDPIQVEVKDVSTSGGYVSFSAVVKNPGPTRTNGKLYVAAYSAGGRMTGLEEITVTLPPRENNCIEKNFHLRGEKARIYFVDEQFEPLMESIEVM